MRGNWEIRYAPNLLSSYEKLIKNVPYPFRWYGGRGKIHAKLYLRLTRKCQPPRMGNQGGGVVIGKYIPRARVLFL